MQPLFLENDGFLPFELGLPTHKGGSTLQESTLAYVDIARQADTVKTFDGRIWRVKGLVGVDDQTGKRKHLAELYYNIALIKDNKWRTIARRKKRCLPLKLWGK